MTTNINPNYLHSNKFKLGFSRIPNVQYFCQSVSIPGISMSEAYQPTPFIDLYSPGDKAVYDVLVATFIIDEELTAWKEIHDWIRAMTFPEEFEEYKNLDKLSKYYSKEKTPQYSDATLTLLSSNNVPNHRFKFYDVFPTSLTSFVVNTQDSPENILTADVTFRFSYFDIEKA